MQRLLLSEILDCGALKTYGRTQLAQLRQPGSQGLSPRQGKGPGEEVVRVANGRRMRSVF